VDQLGPPLAELLEPVISPELPILRYEVRPQLLSVLTEVLGKGLSESSEFREGDIRVMFPIPEMRPSSSPTVLKRLLGNRWCLARDSDPSSLIRVLSQSDAPLKQSAV
jgi:hypothetical protein